MAKKARKGVVIGLAAVILVVAVFGLLNSNRSKIEPVDLAITPKTESEGLEYSQYLQVNQSVPDATQEIYVPLNGGTDQPVKLVAGSEGLTVEVNVPKKAWYGLAVEYAVTSDAMFDYDLSIAVNGKVPYNELNDVPVKAQWEIDKATYEEGASPKLKYSEGRLMQLLYDRGAYIQQPLLVCLEEGINTLHFTTETLDFEVYGLRLRVPDVTPNYEEYKKTLSNRGGERVYFQAEYPTYRNAPTILELIDSTSPDTVPVSPDKTTINTIGGTTFATPQNKITWTFTTEKAGTYILNMRIRQDYANGATVCRALYLDGEIPFEECRNLEITHSNGFRQWQPGDENGAYCFELEAGTHTLALEAVLGNNGTVVQEVDKVLDSLNTIYRRIIVLTSPNPDPYRDYDVEKKLPEVVEEMDKQAKVLENVIDYLIYKNGGRGSDIVELENMQRQLEDFVKEPESIPGLLSSLSENISAVGTWISEKKEQPLEIDWIEWSPVSEKPSETKTSLWGKLAFSVSQFWSAYTADYKTANSEKSIDVWVGSVGRDQYLIISNMIRQQFTKETGIDVNFKLVQGALMPAIVSGIGPDVSIFNGSGECINYAVRKAVYPLSGFEGFDELAAQFPESALTPLRLEGKVYGIPEQLTFPVLFYRKDVFNEMGYEVPETWDDAYQLMFELQKNNMEFGIPAGLGGYSIFLYQNGGQLYSDAGDACLLNTETNITAFQKWVKYFTDFSVPLSYNFINRFRTGEMPIGIAGYTTFNTLIVFAPEIYGEWDIACVPGTVQEDGSIDHSVTTGSSCVMMFESSNKKGESWEFIRWWGGSEAQLAYAKEIETKLGATARYPVANSIAFNEMFWTPRQMSVLKEQMQYLEGIPEIPGSYFTARHFENAFRRVAINGADIKETLVEYTALINTEIAEKREELNIDKGVNGE